jgi:FtsZ-binding cell division protein ZapB
MVSLEQVQLLETRVTRAIEYVGKLSAENAALAAEKASLMSKLDVYQKRIDELEVLVMRFKDEQSRIEDGIISALDRLNQFEEAVEKSLREKQTGGKLGAQSAGDSEKLATQSAGASEKLAVSEKQLVKPEEPEPPEEKEVFFEISEAAAAEAEDDIDEQDDDSAAKGGLDIF